MDILWQIVLGVVILGIIWYLKYLDYEDAKWATIFVAAILFMATLTATVGYFFGALGLLVLVLILGGILIYLLKRKH
jgi:hypothetical protein